MKWIDKLEPTRPQEIKPMGWDPRSPERLERYTKTALLCLLIALSILLLSGCSKAVSVAPMPLPPANLASNCEELDPLPVPFFDPDRAIWEAFLLARYADCSAKHRLTVEAWRSAVKAAD